jgi:putative LysE/RhtB family amino acid efflux pump
VGADALLFLKAALAGVVVSLPPGPVAALCVGRAARGGAGAGLLWALGAALADALHGVAAAVGAAVPLPLAIAVAAALALALRRRRPAAGAFAFAIAAPGTLPALAALYAALGVSGPAGLVGAGVFTGAALWWAIVAAAAARLWAR